MRCVGSLLNFVLGENGYRKLLTGYKKGDFALINWECCLIPDNLLFGNIRIVAVGLYEDISE